MEATSNFSFTQNGGFVKRQAPDLRLLWASGVNSSPTPARGMDADGGVEGSSLLRPKGIEMVPKALPPQGPSLLRSKGIKVVPQAPPPRPKGIEVVPQAPPRV